MAEQTDIVVTSRRGWPGRLGLLFAAVWLVFLFSPAQEAWARRDSWSGWVGLAGLGAFAVVYMRSFAVARARQMRIEQDQAPLPALLFLGSLTALAVVVTVAVGQWGTSTAVYIAVTAVMWLPGRVAFGVVAVVVAVVEVLARVVAGWDKDSTLTFAVCTASFAMWGVNQVLLRNLDLLRARDENARLAVSAERNRFARDLHDILGHSLTVITVKAELANRLIDIDPERARAEIGDLERLSRDALTDVRRAVQGCHDLTLPGELARAREALTAADIEAELPRSTDEVPSELRELFAWTVREGVTNVIRHSGASRCVVRLGATEVEVRDDGSGPPDRGADGAAGRGHGLDGLRERAAAAGAVLVTRTVEPTGFVLSVLAR